MELLTASNILFFILAAAIIIFGRMTVTSKKVLRAATSLFFVLFCIAGLYLQMNYEFLAAVQLSVYAGGIVVLFVFAILLIKNLGEETEQLCGAKRALGIITALTGLVICIVTIFKFGFITDSVRCNDIAATIDMNEVGQTLMGTEKFQYILPFEAASVLLLACIVGSIVIAQNHKEEKK